MCEISSPQKYVPISSSCDCFLLCLQEKSSYSNGKAIHKITVVPRVNLTVTCSVSNKLGEDTKTINVASGKLMLVRKLVGWLCFPNCGT